MDKENRKYKHRNLIVTVGLPKSGKSTWALSTGFPIVNLSSIRKSLYNQRYIVELEPWIWNLSRLMIQSLFEAGHDTVILDGTATLKKRRDPWKNLSYCNTVFKEFDIDKEICIKRAQEQQDLDIIPIILEMAETYEPLEENEIMDYTGI